MGRILAIDYGSKRTGLAATDTSQLIAQGLATIATSELVDFLKRYVSQEEVDMFILGEPLHLDGRPASRHADVIGLSRNLRKLFPDKSVILRDERFTSLIAKEMLLESGIGRKKRREKGRLDEMSAVVILRDYLDHRPPTIIEEE